jgi:hypothetical protein
VSISAESASIGIGFRQRRVSPGSVPPTKNGVAWGFVARGQAEMIARRPTSSVCCPERSSARARRQRVGRPTSTSWSGAQAALECSRRPPFRLPATSERQGTRSTPGLPRHGYQCGSASLIDFLLGVVCCGAGGRLPSKHGLYIGGHAVHALFAGRVRFCKTNNVQDNSVALR